MARVKVPLGDAEVEVPEFELQLQLRERGCPNPVVTRTGKTVAEPRERSEIGTVLMIVLAVLALLLGLALVIGIYTRPATQMPAPQAQVIQTPAVAQSGMSDAERLDAFRRFKEALK